MIGGSSLGWSQALVSTSLVINRLYSKSSSEARSFKSGLDGLNWNL